uniref:Uncharacterized protein n=1 Tax=Aegilops tauschii subsp. strangulata TaxID=200361 RepID=A0A453FRR0_AEGTS
GNNRTLLCIFINFQINDTKHSSERKEKNYTDLVENKQTRNTRYKRYNRAKLRIRFQLASCSLFSRLNCSNTSGSLL